MVGRYHLVASVPQSSRGRPGAGSAGCVQRNRGRLSRPMNQRKQITPYPTGLRCHYSLRCHDGDGGVDGVAPVDESMPAGLSRQVMWGGYRRWAQETLRSGRRRFKASSTARTTALASSSSTTADPINIRSVASVTSTIWATAM